MFNYFKLSFLLLLFNLLALPSLAQIYCDPDNRTQDPNCPDLTFSVPACAYYKGDCSDEICSYFVSNKCEACLDPRVLYYKLGWCTRTEENLTCSSQTCREGEEDTYRPVCGFREEDDGKIISKTFSHACKLCNGEESFDYFRMEPCVDERKYCNTTTRKLCGKRPVCTLSHTIGIGSIYVTTPRSKACADPAVEYFVPGECGQDFGNITHCLPNYRPQDCREEYAPVCATYRDIEGQIDQKTMDSPCKACLDSDVWFHKPGPCFEFEEFECERDPKMIYECTGKIGPVCGKYVENEEEKFVSLRNECLGCHKIPVTILTFTKGLCPGDEGIRCEYDAIAREEVSNQPVCGYTAENCHDNSCRQTFDEPGAACKNSNVIWYSFGECSS